mmetsp:Transcript_81054/g.216456  ORF Transcript_81054/g.216456 Transcript_81054/m.216456 type:complete len:240 (+) Transcript_81054:3755-4474(+)
MDEQASGSHISRLARNLSGGLELHSDSALPPLRNPVPEIPAARDSSLPKSVARRTLAFHFSATAARTPTGLGPGTATSDESLSPRQSELRCISADSQTGSSICEAFAADEPKLVESAPPDAVVDAHSDGSAQMSFPPPLSSAGAAALARPLTLRRNWWKKRHSFSQRQWHSNSSVTCARTSCLDVGHPILTLSGIACIAAAKPKGPARATAPRKRLASSCDTPSQVPRASAGEQLERRA